jgi:hypothetical protein
VASLFAVAASPSRPICDRRSDAPAADEEDEELWLERAREAEALGPLGLHTTGRRPITPARRRRSGSARPRTGEWVRSTGLDVRLFCGGGWYFDADVAARGRRARLRRLHGDVVPPVLPEDGAPHLKLDEPTWLELGDGLRLLELPTTHSIGMLARGVLGPVRPQVVHAYFHDTDLLDRAGRAGAPRRASPFLGLKRTRDRPARASARLAAREHDVVREQPR